MRPRQCPSVSILVSSCDGYSDLWDGCVRSLRKHGGDHYPIYLGAEVASSAPPGVTLLLAGLGCSWSVCLRRHLEAISDDYVLLILDDFWLRSRPDWACISAVVAQMAAGEWVMVRLNPRPFGEGQRAKSFTFLRECTPLQEGRIVVQPALWRRSALLGLIEDKESAWQFERRVGERALGLSGLYCSTQELWPCGSPLFHHCVEKGKWIPTERFYWTMRLGRLGGARRMLSHRAFIGLCLAEGLNGFLRLIFRERAPNVRKKIIRFVPAKIYDAFARFRGYR